MAKKPEISLRARAMRFLARREYSRIELHGKLLPHVQEGDNLDEVLDELVARGWLSDARATTQLLHAKRHRFGAQRIEYDLKQKGIPEHLIEDALAELRVSELDSARAVWDKKFGILACDTKEKSKQIRFLQSRGFSMEVIFKVLKLS